MTDHSRDDSCGKDGARESRTGAARSRLCVRSKIWIELDGEPVLGQGRLELLRLVGKSGSINAAAKEMGIPYRKAWTYIDSMEKRLGFPLVLRSKGGSGGGASTLTPEAESLLQKFEALQKGFEELVNGKFAGLGFAL
ncbi:LysR family transcriptional regulator [Geomonas terrae]|uniref:LysR family transcriptional regulator n=1 Tax=Geomonas terrae TaxID=2562681 RepID=A0A4S1CME1_9BACT|nr:LysR family transcriptional regulator [Geomonas terrae]TGU74783.1 LysR family transcriptional regulator [Geomonas terrae]